MSRSYKDSRHNPPDNRRGRRRNISVRGVRRDVPDYRKLSRAVVELALAQAEAEAAQSATSDTDKPQPAPEPHDN